MFGVLGMKEGVRDRFVVLGGIEVEDLEGVGVGENSVF